MAYGSPPPLPRKKGAKGVLPQVQQNIQQDARNRMLDILPEGGMMGGMLGASGLAFQGGGQAGLPSQLPLMPMRLPPQLPLMPMPSFPPIAPVPKYQ